MDWRRPGDKPLSESLMVSLLTDICVTRPQWVKVTMVIWILEVRRSLREHMDLCLRCKACQVPTAWNVKHVSCSNLKITVIGVSWLPYPDSKVHGAIMGPTWGWQDPGGPHVGPMNLAIWVIWSTWNYEVSHVHLDEKSRVVYKFMCFCFLQS